jgi:hypothetical protein
MIDESRQRLEIPDDWLWQDCANPTCPNFVWFDPQVQQQLIERGTPFLPVCSNDCAFPALHYFRDQKS